MPFDPSKPERVKRFIEGHCTYSTGTKFKGKPFNLIPWQYEDTIVPFFGTVDENGLRQYRYCYVEIAKKNGKALDLDTDIPTVDGWKKIRDVEIGDRLFDETGAVCSVIGMSPVMHDRPCYEIT